MVRKLKIYQTSLGFFDQAIAAPSMKAALEAWGADSNLFHQGAAAESDDPQVIAATMKKPGVVLRRPVGSNGPFSEHAGLPKNLIAGAKPPKSARKMPRHGAKKPFSRPDTAINRKAGLVYEREEKRRKLDQAKKEATERKDRERRQRAVDKAQAALDEAEQEHTAATAGIQAQIKALQKELQAEDEKWNRKAEQLKAVLRRARN
jgi:hypothetical protein